MPVRSRKFSCITYLNETQLNACLSKHFNQIRAYEYIFHDLDTWTEYDEEKNPSHVCGHLKEPHFHLIIVTFHQCTISAIRKWFSGFVDENGDITTTAQVVSDIDALDEYLTHRDKKSRAEGKVLYPLENIVSSDPKYFGSYLERDYDNSTIAVELLLKGVPIKTIAQMFGKDFIYHYSQIKQVVNDIQVCEKHNIKDIAHLLDYQQYGSSALWDIDDEN